MFNLIFTFILLLCQTVNTKNKILFPQNRFQIFQQKWGSCNNSSSIQPLINNFEQPIQLPISYNNPLCLHDLFQFSLSEPMSFYYFVFNRTIEYDDLLLIIIDGKIYYITQETATDNFVLIRHQRFCSYNSIEFYLISKTKDLGLKNYLILISENQNQGEYNQVLSLSHLIIGEEYQITQYNLQTKNQKIINSILIYEGQLSFENIESVSSCLEFNIFNFYEQMKCINNEIDGKIRFVCTLDINKIKDVSQIKDLSFLILSQYTFHFYTPCFPKIPDKYIQFQTIQQISDNNYSSIANHIQELKFGQQHQININYNYTIKFRYKNQVQISLNPYESQQCLSQFEEAFITIKNSLGETVKCDLSYDYSCLSQIDCSFFIDLDFKDNVGYIFNLTAIVKRPNMNSPSYQFFLVDIVLKDSVPPLEPDYNFTFIAILLILSLSAPIICFLLSTFILNIPIYDNWLREIYNYESQVLKT
ncbi:unnamed protein product [Paramecium primaurelia]|uniref:Transmembrane protein n=1 Tax=Paramecium primaurelia TaxID=5886 RepID=A0A8S1JQR5_PARPR|nr:unnamed protein product [Paramecium primaurelia]